MPIHAGPPKRLLQLGARCVGAAVIELLVSRTDERRSALRRHDQTASVVVPECDKKATVAIDRRLALLNALALLVDAVRMREERAQRRVVALRLGPRATFLRIDLVEFDIGAELDWHIECRWQVRRALWHGALAQC
jgi:hypothetical protein